MKVDVVKNKGPLSRCCSCNELIPRGNLRVIHKHVPKNSHKYYTEDSYHYSADCASKMSEDLLEKLTLGRFNDKGYRI